MDCRERVGISRNSDRWIHMLTYLLDKPRGSSVEEVVNRGGQGSVLRIRRRVQGDEVSDRWTNFVSSPHLSLCVASCVLICATHAKPCFRFRERTSFTIPPAWLPGMSSLNEAGFLVLSSLQTLYHDPHPQQKKQANEWLQEFQHSVRCRIDTTETKRAER